MLKVYGLLLYFSIFCLLGRLMALCKRKSTSLNDKDDMELAPSSSAPIYKGKPPTDEAVPMLPTDEKPPAAVTDSGDKNTSVTPAVTVTPATDKGSNVHQGAGEGGIKT